MKQKRYIILLLLCALLCTTTAFAGEDMSKPEKPVEQEQPVEPEETTEPESVIRYWNGYAVVEGTEAHITDQPDTVIGTKTYTYHALNGDVLFTYSVTTAFTFDGEKAEQTSSYTTFYVSDGWEKQADNLSGKAVFTDGKRKRKLNLTVHCSKTGEIS